MCLPTYVFIDTFGGCQGMILNLQPGLRTTKLVRQKFHTTPHQDKVQIHAFI